MKNSGFFTPKVRYPSQIASLDWPITNTSNAMTCNSWFCEYLASPNHIPRYPTCILLANTCTFFWIVLLACMISLNKLSARCTEPERVQNELVMLKNITIIAYVLVCFYLILSSSCRYFLKIRYQDKSDANRAKLAMCTPGLCMAQKRRILKTNFGIDMVVLIFETSIIILQFTLFHECSLDNECIIPCTLQAWIPALPFFIFTVLDVLLKTSFASSEFDYCIQSQQMEAHLHNKKLKGWLSNWFYLTEKRQQLSVAFCLIFVIFVIIEGFILVVVVSEYYLPLYIGWGVQLYAMGAVLLIIDGGVILLPWTVYTLMKDSSLNSKDGYNNILTRLIYSRNLPRRKAIPMLFITVVPFAFCASIKSYLGGPRTDYFISNTSYLVWVSLLFIWQLVLADMPVSMNMLLQTTGDGNFGLVMSRKHFVDELKHVQSHLRSTGNNCYDINVPTYLASQARVELCIVVSYRWSNEALYLKKNPEINPQPTVIKLTHTSCDGFDWTVCIIQQQLDALIEYLTGAKEPYVWMDQFSIPQVSTSSNMCYQHELRKQEVRNVLIPKMTGLYSCNSRVIALNNSSDVGLVEEDWYHNRLWCVQEYCFPSILDIVPKLDSNSATDGLLMNRRTEVSARWFANSSKKSKGGPGDRNKNQANTVNLVPSELESQSIEELESTECLDILLDWLEADAEVLDSKIKERVQIVGSIKYLEMVQTLGASDTNDTLSALAQPWFGIILTSVRSKEMIVNHIVRDALRNETQSVTLINNSNVNLARFSGSCSLDRMLSGQA